MEESNFMKAEVDADQSNAVKRMEEVKSVEDDPTDKKRINLGQDLVGMLLQSLRRVFEEEVAKSLQKKLMHNYLDFVKICKFNMRNGILPNIRYF